mmetsp:Transcript_19459/g.47533  ORF Transcript_19459/g.47533 Transcript_19459/m.47533 type:complete len:167 (+) Transcript_19459:49-549(+)
MSFGHSSRFKIHVSEVQEGHYHKETRAPRPRLIKNLPYNKTRVEGTSRQDPPSRQRVRSYSLQRSSAVRVGQDSASTVASRFYFEGQRAMLEKLIQEFKKIDSGKETVTELVKKLEKELRRDEEEILRTGATAWIRYVDNRSNCPYFYNGIVRKIFDFLWISDMII